MRRVDHSSRGVLPSAYACVIECDLETSIKRRPGDTGACRVMRKKSRYIVSNSWMILHVEFERIRQVSCVE